MSKLSDWFERVAYAGLKPGESAMPGPMPLRKKMWIGAAVLTVAGIIAALVIVLQRPARKPEAEAARVPLVQIVKPGVVVEKNRGLSVEEINFDRTRDPKEITGVLRNLTDKRFEKCEVSFDVTTKEGGQLGGVSTVVRDVAPRGAVRFRILVPQQQAAFAMVRELHPE